MRDIVAAHFGNGLTVYDKNDIDEETNDFRILAHIDKYRIIKYSIKKVPLTEQDKIAIDDIARFDDRTISVTQDEKVFEKRPKIMYIITGTLRSGKRFEPIRTHNPQHYNVWSGTLWESCRDGKRKLIKHYIN